MHQPVVHTMLWVRARETSRLAWNDRDSEDFGHLPSCQDCAESVEAPALDGNRTASQSAPKAPHRAKHPRPSRHPRWCLSGAGHGIWKNIVPMAEVGVSRRSNLGHALFDVLVKHEHARLWYCIQIVVVSVPLQLQQRLLRQAAKSFRHLDLVDLFTQLR
eukprot:CAMPEP_0194555680 /NCGR_PEP_ID=MMETSP0253-20130528/98362_1 /TAXON_ID=2966 /ORGANISM="Noctiluca scintillans" /LENGTH=159 /DNA_ID=CAMNT_0039403179 /DNA_START=1 /DNA_END=481 /DNA_ORIENTATION=+